jgi:aminocarboxymuconate-semialdehyde decarboxylase
MIVDCHAHLVPQPLLDLMRKERARFPSVRLIEDGANLSFSFTGGKPTRPVAKGLSDIPARLAWMDN